MKNNTSLHTDMVVITGHGRINSPFLEEADMEFCFLFPFFFSGNSRPHYLLPDYFAVGQVSGAVKSPLDSGARERCSLGEEARADAAGGNTSVKYSRTITVIQMSTKVQNR